MHDEFVMASGEMSKLLLVEFLRNAIAASRGHLIDDAILCPSMDWRHIDQLVAAVEASDLAYLNLLIWAKTNVEDFDISMPSIEPGSVDLRSMTMSPLGFFIGSIEAICVNVNVWPRRIDVIGSLHLFCHPRHVGHHGVVIFGGAGNRCLILCGGHGGQ